MKTLAFLYVIGAGIGIFTERSRTMKFTLDIELGNDAMQTANDVGLTLVEWGCKLRGCNFEDEKLASIFDTNGNNVGREFNGVRR
jgi:hypothetical protein